MLSQNTNSPFLENSIAPFKEIVAYEALWKNEKASFKTLSHLFRDNPNSKPSDFVSEDVIQSLSVKIREFLFDNKLNYKTNLLINGTFDYPKKLKDAIEPVEVLYYSGNLDYLSTRSVAIVGTRHPTPEGLKRTSKLVNLLVQDRFTIVSGLAMGIDTQAHTTAIEAGGKTIAVIGTPMNTVYPKTNEELQKKIAKEHLLISQVPFYRYSQQGINGNKLFFPERNKTMSALSEATIIIEAGETSGTLVQARAALQQGRHLFILESCFQNKQISWPEKFLKQGAIRVKEYSDIQKVLLNEKTA
jgi:DNA processing protein